MKVLSNLFGLNKKISASDIAIKDNSGKAKTLDNYLYTINEYSTDEEIIGKWIDGKLIYRKVVELPKITTTNVDVTVNCNVSNLQQVINIEGIIYINNSQGDLGIPLNFYNSAAQQYSFLTFYRKSTSQIIMRVWTATIGGFAMLYYTKTTD